MHLRLTKRVAVMQSPASRPRLVMKKCFGACTRRGKAKKMCTCLRNAVLAGQKRATCRLWRTSTIARFRKYMEKQVYININRNWARRSAMCRARITQVSGPQPVKSCVNNRNIYKLGYTTSAEYIRYEMGNNPEVMVTYIEFELA